MIEMKKEKTICMENIRCFPAASHGKKYHTIIVDIPILVAKPLKR
jgi:hypothetical protein